MSSSSGHRLAGGSNSSSSMMNHSVQLNHGVGGAHHGVNVGGGLSSSQRLHCYLCDLPRYSFNH